MAEAPAAGAGAKEEEPGFLSKIGSAIGAFFFFIFECVMFVFKQIYNLIVLIVACFEFIWYPIKERIMGCCSWCHRSKSRSDDPHYSTFDREV